ncbi:hypothetical protein [Deinococcus sp.]|uniref:hypothetical protein n=1 Tax=Deinococcus sp. TaxID=47478 RepID=UPI003C7E532A
MNRALALSFVLTLTPGAVAQTAQTQMAQSAQTSAAPVGSVTVPREKISLTCADSYFKTDRTDFILQDEVYPLCTLSLPLALGERWPGKRVFYVIPRVSANLYAKDSRGEGRWLPLSPLVTPGPDPLHTTLSSRGYRAVELTGKFGKLSDLAGTRTPDTVGVGGKVTVCVAPVMSGEAPCVTFDVTGRFRVYHR